MLQDLNRKFAKLQFSTKKRIGVYRKLSSMLNNNVTLNEAFGLLYKQASQNGKKPNEGVAVIFREVIAKIDNGEKVGSALSEWVSEGESMMIMAGEDAGDLHKMLLRISENLEKKGAMVGALFGLTYPFFLLLMVCAFLVMFGVMIVPQFAQIVPPENWSGYGYSLYVMSQIVIHYGIFVGIGIAGLIFTVIFTLPRWTGPTRVIFDKIPPWSIYRMIKGGDFLVSVNTLLSAGARLEDTLKKLKANSSPWMKERIDSIFYNVSNGFKLGSAMEKSGHQFPSQDIIDDLVIYEKLSDMNKSIGIIAKEWIEEGVVSIQKQVGILTVVIFIMLGGTTAWLVSGMFSLQQMISTQTGSVQQQAK